MADKFYESIPFLMHCIVARGVDFAARDYRALGLNVADARVLMAALLVPGIRAGRLAEIACIAPSTLSHLLRRLGRDGLILRARVDDDNRSVMVHLTPAGKRTAQECQRLNIRHEQLTMRQVDPKRIAALRPLLRQILDNVEAANPGQDVPTIIGRGRTAAGGRR